MSSKEEIIQKLTEEKESLLLQVADLNYLLELREEELNELKNSSKSLQELKSKIEEQLYDFEHMQNLLGQQQQLAIGQSNREIAMEKELLNTLDKEKSYYTLKEQFHSTSVALSDLQTQLKDMMNIYKELLACKNKLAASESNLEITLLDNQFLKEELEQLHQTIQNKSI